MKKKHSFLFCIIAGLTLQAQLKTTKICPPFAVEILDGRVNELRITDNITQIKEKLPCYSSMETEGTTAKCGGGIFYKDQDIYFYTAGIMWRSGLNSKANLAYP
jgi:hypothetical protein